MFWVVTRELLKCLAGCYVILCGCYCRLFEVISRVFWLVARWLLERFRLVACKVVLGGFYGKSGF